MLTRDFLGFLGRGGRVTNDIDTAFEVGVVLDDDTGGLDIADEAAFFANRNLLRGLDVTLDLALDDYFASFHIRLRFTVRAYRTTAVLDVDVPFDVTIDEQVFLADDVADDCYGFADGRTA